MEKMNSIRAKPYSICSKNDDKEQKGHFGYSSTQNSSKNPSKIIKKSSRNEISDSDEEIIRPTNRAKRFRVIVSSDEENDEQSDEEEYIDDNIIVEKFCSLGIIKAWCKLDKNGQNINYIRNCIEQFLQLKLECKVPLEKILKIACKSTKNNTAKVLETRRECEFLDKMITKEKKLRDLQEIKDIESDSDEYYSASYMSEEIDKDEDEGNFTDVSEATTVLCHNHIETECDTDVRSSEDELIHTEETLNNEDFVQAMEKGESCQFEKTIVKKKPSQLTYQSAWRAWSRRPIERKQSIKRHLNSFIRKN